MVIEGDIARLQGHVGAIQTSTGRVASELALPRLWQERGGYATEIQLTNSDLEEARKTAELYRSVSDRPPSPPTFGLKQYTGVTFEGLLWIFAFCCLVAFAFFISTTSLLGRVFAEVVIFYIFFF